MKTPLSPNPSVEWERDHYDCSCRQPVWSPGFSQFGPFRGQARPLIDGAAGRNLRRSECPFHEPEGRARQSSARRLRNAKFRRARSGAPYRFMVPMNAEKIRKGPFHEPYIFRVRAPFESGGGPPHSTTLARWPRSPGLPPGFGVRRPCGALDFPGRFMAPMRAGKGMGAFHEPYPQAPAPENTTGCRRSPLPRRLDRLVAPKIAPRERHDRSRMTHKAPLLWLILLCGCAWGVAHADDLSTA